MEKPIKIEPITLRKSELADKYGMKPYKLQSLMNKRFFKELSKVGYKKQDIELSPTVVRKFIELWGEPLTEKDMQPKLF